jgi:hypothetical protein
MKTRTLASVCAMTMFLVGWGITRGVMAEPRVAPEATPEQVFANTIGAAAQSTDVYGILCPIGTSTARADVNDNGGVDGILISVCLSNSHGQLSQCRTAPDNGSSATAIVSGGAGLYFAVFHKTGGNTVEDYDTFINCHNAGGAALGGDAVIIIQNQ